MSIQRSTRDLKNEVLAMCGELQNGASQFETKVVDYMNRAYKELLSGGNIVNHDASEPWIWAELKRPLLGKFKAYVTGTITLTNGSNAATFGTGPSASLEGWFVQIEGEVDYYNVAKHAAAATAVTLDQEFLGTSGSYNYKALKLDYELTSDNIIITSKNNIIDFSEAGGALSATITTGVYTPTTLCAEIVTRLDAAGDNTYAASFSTITRKFTISANGNFSLLFASGSNVFVSAGELLGFDCEDLASGASHTSEYALNSFYRLTKPIAVYQEAPEYVDNARDSGKVFMIDANTFLRDYPINRMYQRAPDRFCVIDRSKSDIFTVRMNGYLDEELRFEVQGIPVHRKLMDSANSYPIVPEPHVDFLVYTASYFIMLDKKDSKANEYMALAQSKLKSMIADNRKGLQLSGQNYGRMIARPNQAKRFVGW